MTLAEIFSGISRARVAVIGDFCLDAYWLADLTRSELSRESPHYPLPVIEERMSPGGAGNVACNLAALRPGRVTVLGVIGADWRGSALKGLIEETGADASALLSSPRRVTPAYIKPLRKGISDTVYEDPRLDFDNYAPLDQADEEKLLDALSRLDADVLCVCDQMKFGCVTPAVREALGALGRRGMTILADSRDRIGLYRDVIVKPNEVEAARAAQSEEAPEQIVRMLSRRNRCPALITLGEKGCLVCENDEVTAIPAFPVQPPVDICGAGDSFLSGLACALAAGAPLRLAARVANAASAVTIQKLHTTGVASRAEIEAVWTASKGVVV